MVLAFAMMTIGFLIIARAAPFRCLSLLWVSSRFSVPVRYPFPGPVFVCRGHSQRDRSSLHLSACEGRVRACEIIISRQSGAHTRSAAREHLCGLCSQRHIRHDLVPYASHLLNFCKTGVFKNTVRDIKAAIEDLRRQTSRESGREIPEMHGAATAEVFGGRG